MNRFEANLNVLNGRNGVVSLPLRPIVSLSPSTNGVLTVYDAPAVIVSTDSSTGALTMTLANAEDTTIESPVKGQLLKVIRRGTNALNLQSGTLNKILKSGSGGIEAISSTANIVFGAANDAVVLQYRGENEFLIVDVIGSITIP